MTGTIGCFYQANFAQPNFIQPCPAVVDTGGGGVIRGGWFSRGKWHDLKRRLREERDCLEAAQARAAGLEGKPATRLTRATILAAEAIRAAETSELELKGRLQKLCHALTAAAGAHSVAQVVAESRAAVQHSQQIIARVAAEKARADEDEEEDEEIILHWLIDHDR